MIVIYPMLVSESISPNVLPGLVKAVEKYILVYQTDEILKLANNSISSAVKSGAKIAAGAVVAGGAAWAAKQLGDKLKQKGVTIPGFNENELLEATTKVRTDKSGDVTDTTTKTSEPLFKPDKPITPKLDIPRNDSVSLEPTWLQITTQHTGMQILGVKVVPFTLKTDGASISSMLMQDAALKKTDLLTKKYIRSFSRVFYRLMQKLRIPTIKDRALTGNINNDMLAGNTQYGKNMFLALSQMDIDNNEIFSTPAGVQKLHKLGWASMILLDDVNKKATFCMKEYGGVCSVVPYGFLYSSLGKEHSKVYEDLEDLKKASGPFFNMRTNRRRAFSEGKVSDLDLYLEMLNSDE